MKATTVSNELFNSFIKELKDRKLYYSWSQQLYDETYRNMGEIDDIAGEEITLAVEYNYHNGKIETCNAKLYDEDCKELPLKLSEMQYVELDETLLDVLL